MMLEKEQLQCIMVPECTALREGLQCMDNAGLQILLIVDAEELLIGVLTDGDVRRALLRGTSLDAPVSLVMNRSFTSLPVGEKHLAVDLIKRSIFNHLPILNAEGRVLNLAMENRRAFVDRECRNIPVVVMAGGKGSRLSPLTHILPKPLVPVGERTMLEKILDSFAVHGFRDFRIIVNYKKEIIKSYFADVGSPYSLVFIDEEQFLGTAGGLSLLKGQLNGTFILTNCDIIAEIQHSCLLQWHREHEAHLTILGVRKRVDIPYGVIKVDNGSLVTEIEEKPYYNHVIVSGVYVLDTDVLDIIPEDSPLGMDDLIRMLIQRGMKVTCYPIENGWFDMGQFEEYRNFLKLFGAFDAS